jgi:hypothetical protein
MLYWLQQRMNIFAETERTEEVAATAYFKVLTWHSFGEENQEKPDWIISVLSEI